MLGDNVFRLGPKHRHAERRRPNHCERSIWLGDSKIGREKKTYPRYARMSARMDGGFGDSKGDDEGANPGRESDGQEDMRRNSDVDTRHAQTERSIPTALRLVVFSPLMALIPPPRTLLFTFMIRLLLMASDPGLLVWPVRCPFEYPSDHCREQARIPPGTNYARPVSIASVSTAPNPAAVDECAQKSALPRK
jgi:hypothetical protein